MKFWVGPLCSISWVDWASDSALLLDAAFLWPQSRKASGPRAVLSAGHLNAAHSVALQRHHTNGKGRRATDLCSVPSFSLKHSPMTRWPKSILFDTLWLLAGHAMNLNWFCS